MSVLPQFLPPDTSALGMGALLAAGHAGLSVLWFTLLIVGAVVVRRWLQRPRVDRAIEGTTGLVLIGLGLRPARPSR